MAHPLDQIRVDRTAFSVAKVTDPSDEIDFWLSKTPEERWEAGEYLRQIAYGYDPLTTRLERVLEFVRKPWG